MSHALRPALTFAACAAILSLSACSSATTADSTASPESASSEATAGSTSEATAGSPADQDASIIPDEARTNVSNLSVGQCVQKPADPSAPLTTVDCSSPHWGEVFFVAPIEDSTLPDYETLNDRAFEACTPAFADYVGTPYDESSLDTTWFFPSSNSWDNGDRIIACVAVPLTEDSLSQSVKNTGM